ncbi:Dehydrogenase [Polystyrenella longa]|uniref:Dehydrogenase n=1 Tax=Polystyrenella longa TaxID=2528007 RepID=A0A518CRD1_9PLAN|nr:Gfo/Idh/MocA family oxidoreductase [Polystyrenella longa]QDU81770.1 Dehydrogenase [Polystyrenella longa]
MSRLKLGVIGVGALGRHHARILSEMNGVDLVGVAEVNPEQGQSVAAACNTTWYTDPNELLDKVDAASIVVPSIYHLDVAKKFISRGLPVMIEKPLAATYADASRIFELAEKHSCLVQVGHIERFNPAFQMVADSCSTPKYIRCERLAPFTFRSTDIGVVHDLMIHDIDLVLALNNSPLARVEAFGASVVSDHEDCAQARLHFENGCIADLNASRIHPEARRTLHCWGYEGSFTADLNTREVSSFKPGETLKHGPSLTERSRRPGADIEQMKQDIFGKQIEMDQVTLPKVDALTAELQNFVDSILQGVQPVVNAQAGLSAMEVAEAVLTSIKSHQWEGSKAGPVGPHFEIPAAAGLRVA